MEDKILTKQKQRMAGAAIVVMSSMVISRITGFLRDALISNMGPEKSDILNAAFSSTNIMYNLLIGGSIAAALIPMLSGYIIKDDEEEGWKAIGTFMNIIFIAMTLFCLLGVIFSPQIVSLVSPGFTGVKRLSTIELTRVLFPSVAFLMLAGLTNGVLYSYKRFAAAAYGPAIYNIGIVLSILLFRHSSLKKISIGIMCSALFYFLFQFYFAFKNFKFFKFRLFFKHSGFITMFKLAIPSLIASSIVQINFTISQRYTTGYVQGSLTAYQNANNLWQLPYGIFAMGIGTAMLPGLSEKLAIGENKAFKESVFKGLKMILFLIIPSAVAIIALGEPIISSIYKWSNKFQPSQISLTVDILMFFSIALFAQSILAIIARAFYAANDTKTPLYVATSTILINGLLCYIFKTDTTLEAAGMSLAASVSSAFNVIVLVYILNRRMKGIHLGKLLRFSVKSLFAAIIMGFVLFFLNRIINLNFIGDFNLRHKALEVFTLGVEVIVGAAVYFSLVVLMKIDEAIYIRDLAFDRIKKAGKIFNKRV
jgi:putative peptidoglycan lipid II flippase